jgi:hypothetical protein
LAPKYYSQYLNLNAINKVSASFENQIVYVGLDVHKRCCEPFILFYYKYLRRIFYPAFILNLVFPYVMGVEKYGLLCAVGIMQVDVVFRFI